MSVFKTYKYDPNLISEIIKGNLNDIIEYRVYGYSLIQLAAIFNDNISLGLLIDYDWNRLELDHALLIAVKKNNTHGTYIISQRTDGEIFSDNPRILTALQYCKINNLKRLASIINENKKKLKLIFFCYF